MNELKTINFDELDVNWLPAQYIKDETGKYNYIDGPKIYTTDQIENKNLPIPNELRVLIKIKNPTEESYNKLRDLFHELKKTEPIRVVVKNLKKENVKKLKQEHFAKAKEIEEYNEKLNEKIFQKLDELRELVNFNKDYFTLIYDCNVNAKNKEIPAEYYEIENVIIFPYIQIYCKKGTTIYDLLELKGMLKRNN